MVASPKILVLRFSALGDVAMTIPVLWSLKNQHPNAEILFVSQPFAGDLIKPIKGFSFFGVNFKTEFKGFLGIIKLFVELRNLGPFNLVADLHGVIRSRIITLLFRIIGIKTITINKGRKDKRGLTRKTNKVFRPLETTFDRYQKVFEKGGYHFDLLPFSGKSIYATDNKLALKALSVQGKKIGIAPFAKHKWKMWPEHRMRSLTELLAKRGIQIFLFGGKGKEQELLTTWAGESANVHNLAGSLSLGEELKIIAELDLMISMDSANMHLASLVETPVISIWGATHLFAGFYGWNQPLEYAVQADLSCRPCSVYGNKDCYRGDFACMMLVTDTMVLAAIDKVLQKNKKS